MGMWVRMLVSAMGIFYLGFSVWIHVLLHVFYLGFWGYGFEKKGFMFLVWFKTAECIFVSLLGYVGLSIFYVGCVYAVFMYECESEQNMYEQN